VNGYNYDELTLGGGLAWSNSGTVDDSGLITVGDSSGGTASLTNQAGAVFDLTDDYAAVDNADSYPFFGSATFDNAGLLEKTGGTGTSTIDPTLTSTGTVEVDSGTLELDGGGSLDGAISGAGTLAFRSGTFTIAADTVLGVQNLLIDGGEVTFLGGLPSDLVSLTMS
jgi:hypothetical protein